MPRFCPQPELSQSSEDAQPLPETQAESDEAQAAAYPEPSEVDVDTAIVSEPDSGPSADQLQSFLANEATLGQMLQLLSQQYQMKTSQSESTSTSRSAYLTVQRVSLANGFETSWEVSIKNCRLFRSQWSSRRFDYNLKVKIMKIYIHAS